MNFHNGTSLLIFNVCMKNNGMRSYYYLSNQADLYKLVMLQVDIFFLKVVPKWPTIMLLE